MTKAAFIKDSFSVLGTKIIVVLLSVGGVILLARGLGPENRGLLAALLIYPQLLVALTEGGMRQAATYFIGKAKAGDGEVLAALVMYVVIAGILGFILVASIISLVGNESFSLAMVLIASAIVPTTLSVNAFKGYFLGKQSIKSFNRTSWVQSVLYILILVILYISNCLSVTTAAIATMSAAIFNACQAWIYIGKVKDSSLSLSFPVLWKMLKIGCVYALALFLISANYKIDIVLIDLLSTAEEVGYYAVSAQLSEVMWQIPGALMLVLMARSANNKKDSQVWAENVALVCRILLLVGIVSSLVMIVFVFFGLGAVFGKEYSPAVSVSIVLILASIFMIPFKILNADFAGQGEPKYAIIIMTPPLFLNIALNVFLIPSWGAYGAAWATFFSYLLCAVIVVAVYSVKRSIKPLNLLLIKLSDILSIKATLKRGAAK